MTPVPTPAQRRALEAIKRGEVERWFPAARRAPYWRAPRGVHGAVVTRCVDARWAVVGPRQNPRQAPVLLTDAGRAVLEGDESR